MPRQAGSLSPGLTVHRGHSGVRWHSAFTVLVTLQGSCTGPLLFLGVIPHSDFVASDLMAMLSPPRGVHFSPVMLLKEATLIVPVQKEKKRTPFPLSSFLLCFPTYLCARGCP